MKISLLFVVLLAVALLVDEGECWRRRRRRRRSGGRWSISNGGVTYTFKNGASVTGHGSLSNGGSVGVKVTIPFGRKRRAVADDAPAEEKRNPSGEQMTTIPPVLDVEDQLKGNLDGEKTDLPRNEESPIPIRQSQNREENCEDCLDIQPFKINDKGVENKTMESNDFVMVVKYIEENFSAMKLQAKIKFEVFEVIKSPNDQIKEGETFLINAEMAKCPCLTVLDPGYYVVTGSVNAKGQLVLSNVLMEFER